MCQSSSKQLENEVILGTIVSVSFFFKAKCLEIKRVKLDPNR